MRIGTQTGAAASAKAAPSLVPFWIRVGPDGHFIFAQHVQALGTPFELEPLVDDDSPLRLLCQLHGEHRFDLTAPHL